MKKLAIAIFAIVTLSGCVQTDSTMLDNRSAIISAQGGAVHTQAEVIKAGLTEAAKLTIKKGFRYFVVLNEQDTTRSGSMYMPGQTYSNGYATGNATSYGNTTYGTATYSGSTYSTPGYAMPFVMPGANFQIEMFNEGEIDMTKVQAWDAQQVIAQDK